MKSGIRIIWGDDRLSRFDKIVPHKKEIEDFYLCSTADEQAKLLKEYVNKYLLDTIFNVQKLREINIHYEPGFFLYFEQKIFSIEDFFNLIDNDPMLDKKEIPVEESKDVSISDSDDADNGKSQLVEIKALVCSSCGAKLDYKKMKDHVIHCDSCGIDNYISTK